MPCCLPADLAAPFTTYYIIQGPSAAFPPSTSAQLRKFAAAVYAALGLGATGYSVNDIQVAVQANATYLSFRSRVVMAVTFNNSSGLPSSKDLSLLLMANSTTEAVAARLAQLGYPVEGFKHGHLSIALGNKRGRAKQAFVRIGR